MAFPAAVEYERTYEQQIVEITDNQRETEEGTDFLRHPACEEETKNQTELKEEGQHEQLDSLPLKLGRSVMSADLQGVENRLIVSVRLNGSGPFNALIDTGARDCVVPKHIVDQCNLTIFPSIPRLQGIGEENFTRVLGEIFCPISLSSVLVCPHNFKVVDSSDLADFIILSRSFLRVNKISIDVKHRIISGLTPDGSSWQVRVDRSGEGVPVFRNVPCRVQVSTVLQPGIVSKVPIKWNNPSIADEKRSDELRVVEGASVAESKLCHTFPGIIDGSGCSTDVLIRNDGLQPVKLRRNEVVATVSTLVGREPSEELSGEVAVVEMDNCESSTEDISHIASNVELDHLTSEQEEGLRTLIREHSSLFNVGDKVGTLSAEPHHIVLSDYTPIYQRPRRFPEVVNREVEEQCNQLQLLDVIEPSTSAWSSPIVPVRKKDGAIRLCIDYRRLNAVTVADKFPLPNLCDAVFGLHGLRFFTSLDMVKGYYQLELSEDSRKYTAFSTPRGHWQFKRLSFGLKNAPSAFQREMQRMLSDLPWSRVMVYIDDILIMSETFEEHLQLLQKVLTTLEQHGITLNKEKCRWARSEVEFLGHVVSSDGIRKPDKYIEDVANFPKPETVRQMREFLGLCNFQRKFIPDCSGIMKPLSQATGGNRKKNARIVWSAEMNDAFDQLKAAISKNVTLAFPDYSDKADPLRLYTDASGRGVGACLAQLQEGSVKPIAYASMAFNEAERRYSVLEKELAAIRWAVRTFRQFIFGVDFFIHTDHQPLVYLNNMKIVNPRLARTMQELAEYSFVIKYTPGRDNLAADSLSRIPHPINSEGDAELKQGSLPEGLLVMREVPGGPDSMLISLMYASQSLRTQSSVIENVSELREALVNEVSRNPAKYGLVSSKSQGRELRLMRCSGQLLCQEILLAFAHLFHCVVLVHYGSEFPVVFESPFEKSDKSAPRRVHLQCLSGVHYNPVMECSGYVAHGNNSSAQEVRDDSQLVVADSHREEECDISHEAESVQVMESPESFNVPGGRESSCQYHGDSHCGTVIVQCDGTEVCALIDTGAQISCVTEQLVEALGATVNRKLTYRITGLGPGVVFAGGVVELPVEVFPGEILSHTFAVLQSNAMKSCLIVGTDFIQLHDMILNFGDMTLSIGGNVMSVRILADSQPVIGIATACEKERGSTVDDGQAHEQTEPVSRELVHTVQRRNDQLKKLRRALLTNEKNWPKVLRKFRPFADDLYVGDGIIFRRLSNGSGAYVVTQSFLLDVALTLHYKMAHPGREKLAALVRGLVWHPSSTAVVTDITRSCTQCQMDKVAPIHHAPVTKITTCAPFELVSVDLLALPTTQRRKVCCLVAIDNFTKWLSVVPLSSKTASNVVAALSHRILPCLPRVPDRILSDNGPEFRSDLFNKLLNSYSIEHVYSTPYRPQSNGLVERANRTLTQLLRSLQSSVSNWDEDVSRAVIMYNNTSHSELKMSPSEFLLRKSHTIEKRLPVPAAAAQVWKDGSPHYAPFKEGQFVLKRVVDKGRMLKDKLNQKYHGPYKVIRRDLNGVTYTIRAADETRDTRAHHSQLRRFYSVPRYISESRLYQQLVGVKEDEPRETRAQSTHCSVTEDSPMQTQSEDEIVTGRKRYYGIAADCDVRSSESSSDSESEPNSVVESVSASFSSVTREPEYFEPNLDDLRMTTSQTDVFTSEEDCNIWSDRFLRMCDGEHHLSMSYDDGEASFVQLSQQENDVVSWELEDEVFQPALEIEDRQLVGDLADNEEPSSSEQMTSRHTQCCLTTGSLDQAMAAVAETGSPTDVIWMSREIAALDLAGTAEVCVAVSGLVRRAVTTENAQREWTVHRDLLENVAQTIQTAETCLDDKKPTVQARPPSRRRRGRVLRNRIAERRHTRSRGPVADLPRVQRRTLEYKRRPRFRRR